MSIWRVVVPVAAGVLGLGVGYVLGNGRRFETAMGFQRTEVRGELSSHANVLCSLRLGETANATRVLEVMLDNAACTLPEGRPYSELPAESQRALAAAKVYRTAYPTTTPNPELDQVLGQVPMPEFKFCANPEGCGLDRVREGLRAR